MGRRRHRSRHSPATGFVPAVCRMLVSMALGDLLAAVVLAGCWLASSSEDAIDVREGEDAVLECHFDPDLKNYSAYWIRSNRAGSDNVVLFDIPFDKRYSIRHNFSRGVYNLHIRGATYSRDNGRFECKLKENGTGEEFFAKSFQLTILSDPGPPLITPGLVRSVEGRPVELTCSSKGGSPDPEIKWYRKGSAHPLNAVYQPGGRKDLESKSVLTLTPNKDDDDQEYRCAVWNRALKEGDTLDTSVVVHVDYYPRVRVGPDNPLRVEVGSRARLDCHVDSSPPTSNVHWTRNGQFLGTSDRDFAYLIPSVSLEEKGTYECVANNGLGQLGKDHLSLDVLYGPKLGVKDGDIQEFNEGQEVRVRCDVTSNPKPTLIEWRRHGDESFRQGGPVLSLGAASAADAGRYICHAAAVLRPYGSPGPVERTTNATFHLRIRHRPGRALIQSRQEHAVEGKSTVLVCGAEPPGWPEPTYEWWRQNPDAPVARGRELSINRTHLSHEGVYHCQAGNAVGRGAPGSFQLEVLVAPRLINHMIPVLIRRAGDSNFSIVCECRAKPQPSASWLKDSEEILPGDPFYEVLSDVSHRELFASRSVLFFRGPGREGDALLPSDRGNYTCLFRNEVQEAAGGSTTLVIEHSPVLRHKHNKVAAEVNESVHIVCRMQAYPQPVFEWTFNGLSSLPNPAAAGVASPEGGEVYESRLKISPVTPANYGEYTCRASNSLGDYRTVIKLQRRSAPEAPQLPKAAAAGDSWILLQWQEGFDGGYENTTFLVSASLSSGLQKQFDCRTYNPCNITDLHPQTAYAFKVKALNARGESAFSQATIASTTVASAQHLPEPVQVRYGRSDRTVEFSLFPPGSTELLALVDVLTATDQPWRIYGEVPVDSSRGQMQIGDEQGEIEGVRVRLCLLQNTSVCSRTVDADVVTSLPQTTSANLTLPVDYLVVIVVVGLALLLLLLSVFAYRCWRKGKDVEKDSNRRIRPSMVTQVAPPPYYMSNGIDNKGVDPSLQKDPGLGFYHSKHAPYHANGGAPAYGESGGGYSNSNHGESSQESLWKGGTGRSSLDGGGGSYAYEQQQHGCRLEPPAADEFFTQRKAAEAYAQQQWPPPPPPPAGRIGGESVELNGLPDPYPGQSADKKCFFGGGGGGGGSGMEPKSAAAVVAAAARNRRVIREIIV